MISADRNVFCLHAQSNSYSEFSSFYHDIPIFSDVCEGNLKSIMRLILALAAHYKPNSVKHSSTGSRSSGSEKQSPNVSAIAQVRKNL